MSAEVVCLVCRRLGVTCEACVMRQERSNAVRMVEGVPYYPFLVRFTLADGRKRRIVRWSPGESWVGSEVVRELSERFGDEGIKGRTVTIRKMVRS